MKIAFLIRQLTTGGAEQQLVRTAVGLASRGHEVTVFTFYPGGALAATLAGSDVVHVSLDKRHRWDFLRFMNSLSHYLRNRQIEILYTFLPSANLIGGVLRIHRSMPRLVCGVRASLMEDGSYDWLGSLIARLENLALKRADAIISNSHAGARRFTSARATGRIHIVPNGIDEIRYTRDLRARQELRSRWALPDEALLVGVVGRLDPMKGHEFALAAFAMARVRHPQSRMVIVGDGSDERLAALRVEAERLGLGDAVTFVPAMQPVASAYSAIDVLISSSIYGEGFSNVLCEGLLCGCRCVATDVGDARLILGIPEYVVPPRDAAALAKALDSAMSAPSDTFWAVARERVTSLFNTTVMLERTEEVLRQLLREPIPDIPASSSKQADT